LRSLSDHLELVVDSAADVKVIFTDLDGTLLGRGGSLFALGDGTVTGAPAARLAEAHSLGVEVIPISGRQIEHVEPVAWVIGSRSYIAEVGTIVSLLPKGSRERRTIEFFGEYTGSEPPYDAMNSSGAVDLLLDRNKGRLEKHTPWNEGRRASHLFRGQVDVASENRALEEAGIAWCRLVDNGVIPRSFEGLEVSRVHAYHLLPKGTGKARAVGEVMRLLGLRREEVVSLGDARADVETASEVGMMFLLRHAVDLDPSIVNLTEEFDNVFVTERPYGLGWAEAVGACLSGKTKSE
jgi:HAD superfamily hydrolase (TIGR01484 family)